MPKPFKITSSIYLFICIKRKKRSLKTKNISTDAKKGLHALLAEVESSRTSLASRTHFEVLGLGLEGQVLGLGLEASSPRKLACPRLEDSSIF